MVLSLEKSANRGCLRRLLLQAGLCRRLWGQSLQRRRRRRRWQPVVRRAWVRGGLLGAAPSSWPGGLAVSWSPRRHLYPLAEEKFSLWLGLHLEARGTGYWPTLAAVARQWLLGTSRAKVNFFILIWRIFRDKHPHSAQQRNFNEWAHWVGSVSKLRCPSVMCCCVLSCVVVCCPMPCHLFRRSPSVGQPVLTTPLPPTQLGWVYLFGVCRCRLFLYGVNP